jgi:hypothetical protein
MLARALRSLCAPRSPWPLALLRIAVAGIILLSPEPRRALELAAGPPELWQAPRGLSWFLPWFSALAPHLWLVHRLLQASALLALLGVWTRASLLVLIASFVVLFGGAQLHGTVLHDMHLLWLLLLLALSPSAQVLSLDAWAAGERWQSATASTSAALAIHFARGLLGLVYFFPGLHKLLDTGAGLGWASAQNLQRQLWLKWFQAGGELPWPRIDHWPLLLTAGGIAVLCFELGFLPCLPWRRGRMAAAAMGLSFHALTQHFLYIPFPSLWLCYVVLWDGPRPRTQRVAAAPSAPRASGTPAEPRAKPRALLVVGVCLLSAVALQGLRGETQAWPFACYPSFSGPAPETIADLVVEARTSSGERRLRIGPLPPSSARRSPAQWSQVWSLAGLYGAPVSAQRLQAFAAELARRDGAPLPTDSVLRFYVESYRTAPEAYGEPPVSRRLLLQIQP